MLLSLMQSIAYALAGAAAVLVALNLALPQDHPAMVAIRTRITRFIDRIVEWYENR